MNHSEKKIFEREMQILNNYTAFALKLYETAPEIRNTEDYPCKHCEYATNCPFDGLDASTREFACLTFFNIALDLQEKKAKQKVNHAAVKDSPELVKNLQEHRLN